MRLNPEAHKELTSQTGQSSAIFKSLNIVARNMLGVILSDKEGLVLATVSFSTISNISPTCKQSFTWTDNQSNMREWKWEISANSSILKTWVNGQHQS